MSPCNFVLQKGQVTVLYTIARILICKGLENYPSVVMTLLLWYHALSFEWSSNHITYYNPHVAVDTLIDYMSISKRRENGTHTHTTRKIFMQTDESIVSSDTLSLLPPPPLKTAFNVKWIILSKSTHPDYKTWSTNTCQRSYFIIVKEVWIRYGATKQG